MNAVFVELDDFAWEDVTGELGADGIEGAGFACGDIGAIVSHAIAKRPETEWVTGEDEFCRRHHGEGIRTLDGVHRAFHRLFD